MTEGSLSAAELRAALVAVRGAGHAEDAARLSSMEVIWLIAELERRHGIRLDLSERHLDRLLTAEDQITTLQELIDEVGRA